jgi:hypothetical protein
MEIGKNRQRNRAWLAPKRGDTVPVAEYGQYSKLESVGQNPLATKRRGLLGRILEKLS